MLLIRIRNPQFLKRPWLFALYTVIGGAWPIYFAGPKAQNIEVISVAAGFVAVLNLWFYLSLRQTLRDQERADSEPILPKKQGKVPNRCRQALWVATATLLLAVYEYVMEPHVPANLWQEGFYIFITVAFVCWAIQARREARREKALQGTTNI